MGPSAVNSIDVCIVGGGGRAGLPLALSFARVGCRVGVYDIDPERVDLISRGVMPFMENGADEVLRGALRAQTLQATTDPAIVGRTDNVVIVVGTPIDEFLNPSLGDLARCIDDIAPHLRDRSLIVLRSTVFPGSSAWLQHALEDKGIDCDVAMCPERITQGNALDEIANLPQIIGADTQTVGDRAARLFGALVSNMIRTTTKEAEFAKLLTNAWRYMKFAVSNHFFMIANSAGLDYDRVLQAVRENYPRAADLPGPGFAAGPCLLKDTMQLAAFAQHELLLAQAAMVVNEGLPNYVVHQIEKRAPLRGKVVAILGMAFKRGNDDTRASLSYKLRKLLLRAGASVLCTDPYVRSDGLVPLSEAVARSEIVIIGAPHDAYRDVDLRGKDVVDVWGFLGPIRV